MGEEKTGRVVTSADVARLAGVSRATVSFALNNTQQQRVSEATRAKVLAAADQLGYVPHAAARSLRAGRSHLVLMPVAAMAIGTAVSDWIDGLQSEFEQHGYTLVLHVGRFSDPVTAARSWAEIRPAGVIVLEAENLTAQGAAILRRAGIKAVVSLASRPVDGVFTIDLDHASVGATAVEHLVARGRQTIGIIMPEERGLLAIAEPRLRGAQEVASKTAATVTALSMAYTAQSAEALADDWAERNLDAVFAFNDNYASLLLHALQNKGYLVPKDVAVVGADDLVQSSLLRPALTSVALDAPTPKQIADTLLSLIETGSAPEVRSFKPVLVHRQSS
ncbi:LacI family DNA-binding transcriptional regulator [Streptomyces zagrosensis]|uniref:DNA-binding LacI/PurR family transcriptional regulator n=1 Tax=Streptomyces zagrosensis TaxID=1042984 RepID=A0A7W9QEC5_9ACTN|nr:LacI family DNA-binding transcriptional regulator [Streptomyces zagrosensis]MBB5938571.1 DNA-binding LacI/PurR family transcriptional regulator [Streptomyces zagrosensis]